MTNILALMMVVSLGSQKLRAETAVAPKEPLVETKAAGKSEAYQPSTDER